MPRFKAPKAGCLFVLIPVCDAPSIAGRINKLKRISRNFSLTSPWIFSCLLSGTRKHESPDTSKHHIFCFRNAKRNINHIFLGLHENPLNEVKFPLYASHSLDNDSMDPPACKNSSPPLSTSIQIKIF